MKKLIVCFILLVCAVPGYAWTKADTLRESAFVALALADWSQTLYIIKHGDAYHEHNIFLGKHPDRDETNRYFAAAIAAHVLVATVLPDRWRPWWQYGGIAFEAAVVGNNVHLGIGFSW